MVIPMSYWKLTEAEIFAHYSTIAGGISLPIMAYNNPATGGLDMAPEFLAKLLQIPNVTMIKESTGDVNRLHRLVQTAGPEVAFFNGSNPLALDAFIAGRRDGAPPRPTSSPSSISTSMRPSSARISPVRLPYSAGNCPCSSSSSPAVCRAPSPRASKSSASIPAHNGRRWPSFSAADKDKLAKILHSIL